MNEQPSEKKLIRESGDLDVVRIFRTIQGEGPFVGMPAVFIRLAGCNLACSWCDTDYTSSRRMMSIEEIMRQGVLEGKDKLVVLTGGEPLRQNVLPLVGAILHRGRLVQIETNGTLFVPGLEVFGVNVVCSPKTGWVDPRVANIVAAWKYVVSKRRVSSEDGLPKGLYRPTQGEVFVQPMDEGDPEANRLNLEATIDSCMRFGYRLSLQVHKIVGLE